MDAKIIKLRMEAQYMADKIGDMTRFPINCKSILKLIDIIEAQEKEIQTLKQQPAPAAAE